MSHLQGTQRITQFENHCTFLLCILAHFYPKRQHSRYVFYTLLYTLAANANMVIFLGCATTVLVTSAGMGEMLLQVLVGSVSLSTSTDHMYL